MSRTVFLTGAAGFVGSNVLLDILENTDWTVIVPITGLHHGHQWRLHKVLDLYEALALDAGQRVHVQRLDLSVPFTHATEFRGLPKPDYILNIASESHVDRSLEDPAPFVRNNVELMLNVLEYAREVQPKLVLQMSTDEVFGPAPEGYYHHEWDTIRPSNPYSASKAAQEALAYSYFRSYNVPLIITNTMNLVAPGPAFQHPEKYVPKVLRAVLNGEELVVHASPDGVPGSRCWIDVRDFARAWRLLIRWHENDPNRCYYPNMPTECLRYNIAGPEASNLEVAQMIAEAAGMPLRYRLVDFHTARPGHDHRYALDASKIALLGWEPKLSLRDTIYDIVESYRINEEA